MRFISSIKHQAILVFALFSVLVTLLYFAIAATVAFIVEDKIITNVLAIEASHLNQQYYQTGKIANTRADYMRVMTLSALSEITDWSIDTLPIQGEIFTQQEDHYHYLLLDIPQEEPLYLFAEVSPLLAVTNTPEFLYIFTGGLSISLLLACLLAFKMASFTVKPVMRLSNAIKAGNRMPELKYELGFLAQTLQGALDNLAQALEREREFTTDVNHELRTPMTILNNLITLIESRDLQPQDMLQLREVSQHMENTIEMLLALARTNALERVSLPVNPVIEQVLLDCTTAHGVECDIVFQCEEDVTVLANAPLFRLLLTNLVNKALQHGQERTLSITVRKNAILMVNRHTNYMQQPITSKGVKGSKSKGIGQGLYLVTRIAEAMGFTIHFSQQDSTFSVQISL